MPPKKIESWGSRREKSFDVIKVNFVGFAKINSMVFGASGTGWWPNLEKLDSLVVVLLDEGPGAI
jgi:hypothetical protein